MNKKSFIWAIAALSLSMATTACSDDKDNDGPGGGSGEMEQYSAEESKEFLEDAAQEAMSLLDPAKQKPLADLCGYFLRNYGELGMPGMDQTDGPSMVASFFRNINSAMRKGDYAGVSRAAYDYVYDIDLDFSALAGIYEPGDTDWKKTGDSKDLIFQFKDGSGNNCKFSLSSNGNFSTGSFEFSDYYDYLVQFNIPNDMTLTLNQGSTSLISLNIVTNINLKGHAVDAAVKGSVMNISMDVVANANDNKVTENATIKIDGNTFLTSTATVNGSNLCNLDYYKTINDDNARTKLSSLLKNGAATVNLINKVQADVEVTYSPALYDALTTYYDCWEFNSETQALAELQKAIATLNTQVKGIIRYNYTVTPQAYIGWGYEFDSWGYGGDYWEYWIEPILVFPDNTSYTFEDYFETGFSGAENAWYNLVNKYETIWGKIFSYLD